VTSFATAADDVLAVTALRRAAPRVRIFFTAIEREICAGDLENRQPVKVPVKFRRNLPLGRSTWSDLFGVGDDDDLTDEGVFHGGVEEKVGDVCARG
jgi:hypothetical protein